ncbi:bifunctional acetate--CoA ligase family protein/GNAT family N-acetyltransferase [Roseococcus thiosulfatophilus]|uniref:bifunctional acetate--CoA ligase family protein/GNAT family N-acetyltransferase n=1 Tax=Roseococcus thiosulfatophilus TaxID=35813 RepID=UPI001A90642B|nr:GNAT family N-acetyltransferase [Roseococcus thiosulfatophilus]
MSMILNARPGPGFRETSLFRPASVVLLADPGLPESAILARNLASGGFQGRLMIEGMAHPGFGTHDAPAELAVLSLAPPDQEEALLALAATGCRAVVVPVAAPGLARMAAAAGVRALGERSFGLAIPALGLNATLAQAPIPRGGLALMAQSSAVARAVLDWAVAEGLGFSHIIGVGANDDIGFAAGLDWLARDTGTACVLLELRRVKQRRLFVSAARAAARTRPVLALRPGARAADPSGVVEAVMEATLRRAGVLSARGLEDWLAAAATLARAKPRTGQGRGDAVAIVANGLGMARLAADAALREGLRLATPGAETDALLAPLLPAGWPLRHPLSLGGRAGGQLLEAARLLSTDPGVDVVVALRAPEEGSLAPLAVPRAGRGAPILFCMPGEARAPFVAAGLPSFATPEAALRGAAHLAEERRNRAAAAELPPSQVLEVHPEAEKVRAIFAAARAAGRLVLYEDEALAVLAAYGVPVVEHRLAATPEEAAAHAEALGPPLVLKARTLLADKSEFGAVMLNLREPASVREAAAAMAAEMARLDPGAGFAGFLLQRQAPRGQLELRLRAGEEAMFGPWIGFGQGGTTAELARDEAFDLPPLNLPLAHGLIARTRLSALLPGFRDRAPVDEAAIADTLVRFSQLLVDFPEIASLDVNPLRADARGVVAVDGHVVLRPAGERAMLAIPPYPAHLGGLYTAPDGRVFEVRPIRPEDAEAQGAMFREMPPEDVRYRFFSVMKELPPPLLARLTQIDYGREMALIATREGRTFATARVIREPFGTAAEFAVGVVPAAKGTGLARHLMARVEEWARAEGVTELVGHVLADNRPMLHFCEKLGYRLRRSPEDHDIMLAVKVLEPAG